VAPVAATQVPTGSSMIGSIDAPVLVITGDHDMASRTRAAKILAGQLTGAERAVIQGAGHLPNLDNPKDYNAVVRTFLERFAVPLR
jgi:pimeloyl-ACP methyl ester carboxylesterase